MVITWHNQFKAPEDLGKAEKANDTSMETLELLILEVLQFCFHLVTKNGEKGIDLGGMFFCKATQTPV